MQGCLTLEVQLEYTKDAYLGTRPWGTKGEDLQFRHSHRASHFTRRERMPSLVRCGSPIVPAATVYK